MPFTTNYKDYTMPGKSEWERNESKREAWLSMCVEC